MTTALSGTTPGAEHHHQQQERDEQHAPEEERQPVGDAASDVDIDGCHPADVNREVGAGDGAGDGGVAQGVDEVCGGLVSGARWWRSAGGRRRRQPR